MTIPSPIIPQPQDPVLLKAKIAACDAGLVAIEAQNMAKLAEQQVNYLQNKSNVTKQRQALQAQLDALNATTTK